ncbi:AraC family transcriptional regulator [Paenibacillus filicis]|uniref:AraC family transcriptional regulator n=1 Tax=Paenibacillus gyeongsangnamensis TaxID=3388067 RepID=A0ABT4Q251_9BACL|nr:AraC family transcriptional regulator [Paenibacillus filicis]MCZ8510960.1 AraC family transcriptional regulator [Paenibacillus filicis]
MKLTLYVYLREKEIEPIDIANIESIIYTEELLNDIFEVDFQANNLTPEMWKCFFIELTSTMEKLLNGAQSGSVYFRKVKSENIHHGNLFYRNIMQYIIEHYNNSNLSLTMVAEHFHITPQYLSTAFKKHLGQNFSNYITGIRIGESKKLLGDSSLSVHQIAQMTGFTNDMSFIRAFKKQEGMTPGVYKETLRGNRATQ